MKAAREGMTVAELKRLVAAGDVASVYLLLGEEALLREEAAAILRAGLLGGDDAQAGTFNFDIVYGDETDAAELIGLCGNLPMFAARRLVLVRNVDDLRAKETERLLAYLEAPVETTCLVLTAEKLDGRTKFFQTLKKVATVVDCGPLEARAVPVWIREQAAQRGLTLDEPARTLLQEAAAGDLGVLRGELDKLAAYVAPKMTVTAADVQAVQGAHAGGTVWDVIETLGRRDQAGALRALAQVLTAGEPPLRLLALLASHWRQVWRVKEQLARHIPETGLARSLGLPPFRIRGLVEQARTFSEGDLARAFEQFREADSRLKGGAGKSEKLVLETVVLALCRSAARPKPTPRPFAPAH